MFYLKLLAVLALMLSVGGHAQLAPDSEVVHPDQRAMVANLPSVTAKNSSASAIAAATVEIVLSPRIKCDPGSRLESSIEALPDASLTRLISKIEGVTCSSAGQAHKVSARLTPNGAIRANDVIASLLQKRPLLMQWKGTLYVLYGVVYDQHLYSSGRQDNVIREFLLIDPRYRDDRHFVTFRRTQNDFGEVEGIASVSVD